MILFVSKESGITTLCVEIRFSITFYGCLGRLWLFKWWFLNILWTTLPFLKVTKNAVHKRLFKLVNRVFVYILGGQGKRNCFT